MLGSHAEVVWPNYATEKFAVDEEFKSRDTLQKEAADWRWRYRQANEKVEVLVQEIVELRQQVQQQDEERKLMNARMNLLARYETASVLMGALAYDFNNLLTVIKGYSEMMRDQLGDVVMQAEVDEVIKAADRASGIVKQLLNLQLNAAHGQVQDLMEDKVERLT